MPLTRFIRNFFITKSARGLFHKNSHINQHSGVQKVRYHSKTSALVAADVMGKKHKKHFSAYKCIHCDNFHIGKNSGNTRVKESLKPKE